MQPTDLISGTLMLILSHFYSGVTKQGFEGCIEDVQLQQSTWDLNTNKKAKGVSPGCPEQVRSLYTVRLSHCYMLDESICHYPATDY